MSLAAWSVALATEPYTKAARIADYARPGEVLVTQAIVDASSVPGLIFSAIGDVELKGVSGAVALHSARRVAAAS